MSGKQMHRLTQLGHPCVVCTMIVIESWGVDRHTMQCPSPISIVLKCKLVSGWGL